MCLFSLNVFEEQHDIWFNLWRSSHDRPPHVVFVIVFISIPGSIILRADALIGRVPLRSHALSFPLWGRRYI